MQCTARLFLPSLFYFLFYLASTLLRIIFFWVLLCTSRIHTRVLLQPKNERFFLQSRHKDVDVHHLSTHLYTTIGVYIFFVYYFIHQTRLISLPPFTHSNTIFFVLFSYYFGYRVIFFAFFASRAARQYNSMHFDSLSFSFSLFNLYCSCDYDFYGIRSVVEHQWN